MHEIAHYSDELRRDLFQETAVAMRVHPAIAEKDFWVCWALDFLFHDCQWKDRLALKGGTSLSKAYGLIERFSEDIDLVLDWQVLGYEQNEPMWNRSTTKQNLFGKEANRRTGRFLQENLVPILRRKFPSRVAGIIEVNAHNENILIRYPRAFSLDAIQPEVRLEIGPMAAWFPHSVQTIRPYAAEYFPGIFKKPSTQIRTIDAERTFWEKATILHQEAHRAPEKLLPPRYSRHYYDLYRMALSPVVENALRRLDLLEDVVAFKQRFYRAPWAMYEAAKPGSFRLLPPEHNRKSLTEDYTRMQAMLFGAIPQFKDIEQLLDELEQRINAHA